MDKMSYLEWLSSALEMVRRPLSVRGAQSRATAPLHQKQSDEVIHLIRFTPACLPLEVFWGSPTSGRPWGRPRTHWRDHVSFFAWEHFRVGKCRLGEGYLSFSLRCTASTFWWVEDDGDGVCVIKFMTIKSVCRGFFFLISQTHLPTYYQIDIWTDTFSRQKWTILHSKQSTWIHKTDCKASFQSTLMAYLAKMYF